MNGLRVLREVVPEHISIFQVGLRVTLLGVDEVGELGGVTKEEDGCVVEDPVPVAFFRPELDCEATGITSGVSRTRLATDSREADRCARLRADLGEELGAG